MKCKDCTHFGYNKYFDRFYCEITGESNIKENVEISCSYGEELKDTFKNGCIMITS